MSSHRVEISEESAAPVRVGGGHVFDDLLHEVLGLPVRVGAVSSLVLLVNRQILRLAVHSGARAEHDLLYVELHHDLHEVGAARDVVAVVLERDGAGLPDRLECREMYDTVNVLTTRLRLGEDLKHITLTSCLEPSDLVSPDAVSPCW